MERVLLQKEKERVGRDVLVKQGWLRQMEDSMDEINVAILNLQALEESHAPI